MSMYHQGRYDPGRAALERSMRQQREQAQAAPSRRMSEELSRNMQRQRARRRRANEQLSPTNAKSDKSTLNDDRREYEKWVRQYIGGSEAQVHAAVDALIRAKANGATGQDAAAAAKLAAASVGPAAGQPQAPASSSANVAPQLPGPAKPGVIVGYAKRIQRGQLMTTSGYVQTLDFQVERPDSQLLYVSMRGTYPDGALYEGDIVEVQHDGVSGGYVRTNSVFNRTSNSVVRMRSGVDGYVAKLGAMWGSQRVPIPGEVLSDKSRSVAGALQLVFSVFFISGIGRMYLGYKALGLLQLVVGIATCGIGAWVWGISDAIRILSGKVPDPQGRPLRDA